MHWFVPKARKRPMQSFVQVETAWVEDAEIDVGKLSGVEASEVGDILYLRALVATTRTPKPLDPKPYTAEMIPTHSCDYYSAPSPPAGLRPSLNTKF